MSNTALNFKDNESNKSDINLERLRLNLEFLMKKKKINASRLAEVVNVSQPTIHRLLTGKLEDPRLSLLTEIANYFSVSLERLLGRDEQENITSFNDHYKGLSHVPVIGWNDVVKGLHSSDLSPNTWSDWLVVDKNISKNSFALKSKRSMEPRFPTNSLLIIDPSMEPMDGDLVVVHYQDTTEATLREIRLDGPKKELLQITGEPLANEISQNIEILGVVVQTRFSYK